MVNSALQLLLRPAASSSLKAPNSSTWTAAKAAADAEGEVVWPPRGWRNACSAERRNLTVEAKLHKLVRRRGKRSDIGSAAGEVVPAA